MEHIMKYILCAVKIPKYPAAYKAFSWKGEIFSFL